MESGVPGGKNSSMQREGSARRIARCGSNHCANISRGWRVSAVAVGVKICSDGILVAGG